METNVNPDVTHRLAIIIPAYKPEFLDETLVSIASQTCKQFTVYIGDDASPHDLRSICERWRGTIDLRYHRFDKNLGSHDLVAQWSRCIALSHEPWIWMFSDDDLMESECVEAFYRQLSVDRSGHSLYHFNVNIIDSDGYLIKETPNFPPLISAREFATKRFTSELISYAPDFVFTRDMLQNVGGFQSFPRAWCSDTATWIKLAGELGIKTISGPKVKWRFSGKNISSHHSLDRLEKFEAAFQFILWTHQYFQSRPESESDIAFSKEKILFSGRWWLYSQAEDMDVSFWSRGLLKSSYQLSKVYGGYFFLEFLRTVLQDIRMIRKRNRKASKATKSAKAPE